MMRTFALGLAFAVLAAPFASAQPAQPAAAPEPLVTVTLEPPRVVVGQKATLLVTVLAPNYMPAPPIIPDFQLRNAVTRSLGAVNETETRGDVTYAGIRYEFAIYPQEAGSYALANQKVTITYAADPPNARKVDVALPRQTFEAFIPDGAQDVDPFVAADSLAVEQKVERSSQDLKVGDSIKRAVTINARGTPAMLLPPATFVNIDGLAFYPDQPVVQDSLDQRSGALSATRTDTGTYMLQRAGDYTLPAIDFAWWNARDNKVERVHADAIVLHVADNPAMRSVESGAPRVPAWDWRRPILWVLDHWQLTLIALLLAGALAWFVPAAVRNIRQRMAARRSAYLASEAWSFARLRAAVRGRDPEKTYFALLDWLGRFAPARTVAALRQSAQDPALDHEISAIESSLFGPQDAKTVAWSPRRLLKRVSVARRRLGQRGAVTDPTVLPGELNPSGRQRYPVVRRPVAR